MNYSIKDAIDVNLRLINGDGSKTDVLFSDWANSSGIEVTSESVKSRAKGVDKLSFNTSRGGTVTFDFEVFDLKWLSVLMGAVESTATHEIFKREVLTVTSNSATLTTAAKAGTATVWTVDTDLRSLLQEQTNSTVTGTSVDTTGDSIADDTKIVVTYMVDQASTELMKIKSDTFPGDYELFGLVQMRTSEGVDENYQLTLHHLAPQGTFNLSFSATEVATLTATFDILSDANNDMITLAKVQ